MTDSKKKQVQCIWSGHPSMYVYAGSYFLALIALIFIFKLEQSLYPDNSYFELVFFLFYALFGSGGASLPWLSLSFLSVFVLQCIFWGIIGYVSFLILQTRITTYTLTTEEIIIRYLGATGLYTDHTELYRLVDFTLLQPIDGMIFGFSTLKMQSTDHSHPTIFLAGISDGKTVLRMIREQTEQCRVKKGVREFTSAAPY